LRSFANRSRTLNRSSAKVSRGKATGRIKPGRIVIISSPSGGGKTSICRRLLTPSRKRQGWRFSVSCTTRKPRRGERDGREYWFLTEEKFRAQAAAGKFAEHFKVHLYRYGTPRKPLDEVVRIGGVIILDVDVQGAARLRKEYPQAITIFVLPPSVTVLRRRLRARGTETNEQLQVRFENARKEMQAYRRFEYTVINADLSTAVNQVRAIIESHPCRTDNIAPEQIKVV